MKEIVYSDSGGGVFKPEPTRAQKRKAKEEAEKRAERWDLILGVALVALFVAIWVGAHIVMGMMMQ